MKIILQTSYIMIVMCVCSGCSQSTYPSKVGDNALSVYADHTQWGEDVTAADLYARAFQVRSYVTKYLSRMAHEVVVNSEYGRLVIDSYLDNSDGTEVCMELSRDEGLLLMAYLTGSLDQSLMHEQVLSGPVYLYDSDGNGLWDLVRIMGKSYPIKWEVIERPKISNEPLNE
ncbi:MAG TPA: hypothetical protein ENJ00_09715 [Phycisphaerales bacterium]|nr:hypothetical protein [Phycisphaerales bacterium]